jgi:3,4-dihydroxy 2-butanone 4-phosphate synthase/GTP cyclohydrolase II
MSKPYSSIEDAITALQAGKMIILVDNEDRENEGDLVIAAQYATPEMINFMTLYGRGLICLSLTEECIDKLNLPMMTNRNRSPYGTAFTVSIEAREGVSTGISAHDRAKTIQVAISPHSTAYDIVTPGHIFPLKAMKGGVLKRTGQTEGSVDLMKLAGLHPSAVICEVMNDDGTMSRRPELMLFAKKHAIPMVTIQSLIDYRIQHETLIQETASSRLPLKHLGDFTMTVFQNELDSQEHFVLSKPSLSSSEPPLVRIHSECITGDVFGSCRCDCGEQLRLSLEMLSKHGGMLIYLRQEGRGIGLSDKLKAYMLQEKGLDTVEANVELGLPVDRREYGIAYQILKLFGINDIQLLTNNPDKLNALQKYGIHIVNRIPVIIAPSDNNQHYLMTKKKKLGHLL